ILTAWVGSSVKSGGTGAKAKDGAWPVSSNILLGVAAPLFAAALIVFLSGALDELLLGDSLVIMLRFPGVEIVQSGWRTAFTILVAGLVVAGVLLWILARLVGKWHKPRLWLFVIVAPLLAAAVVMLLPVAIDALGRLLGFAWLRDPW